MYFRKVFFMNKFCQYVCCTVWQILHAKYGLFKCYIIQHTLLIHSSWEILIACKTLERESFFVFVVVFVFPKILLNANNLNVNN